MPSGVEFKLASAESILFIFKARGHRCRGLLQERTTQKMGKIDPPAGKLKNG